MSETLHELSQLNTLQLITAVALLAIVPIMLYVFRSVSSISKARLDIEKQKLSNDTQERGSNERLLSSLVNVIGSLNQNFKASTDAMTAMGDQVKASVPDMMTALNPQFLALNTGNTDIRAIIKERADTNQTLITEATAAAKATVNGTIELRRVMLERFDALPTAVRDTLQPALDDLHNIRATVQKSAEDQQARGDALAKQLENAEQRLFSAITAFMATNNTTMLTLNTPVSTPPPMANLAASAIALSEKAAPPASEAKG